MKPGSPVMWWRKVSPQGKLVCGLGAVFGLLVGIAALAWIMLMQNQRAEETLFEQNFHDVIDLANLRSNLNAEALAAAMMRDGRQEDGSSWRGELQRRIRADDEILTRLRNRLGSVRADPAVRARLDALTKLRTELRSEFAAEAIPMRDTGRLAETGRPFGRTLALHTRIRALARELEAREAAEAHRLVADGRQRARLYATVFTTAGGVAVTGAAILIFMTHRLIAGHLKQRRRTETELRQANRALRTVNACNQALVRATSELQLLQQVCQAVVTEGGYRLAWVGWAEHDKSKSVRPVAQAGYEEGYLEQAQITWADTERGRGPTGTAIRTGRTAVCRDMRDDPDFAPWRAEALRRGLAASIVLPLRTGDVTIGALSIYSGEPDAFNAEEERLLAALADDLVYGVTALRAREDRRRFKRALSSASMYNRRLIEASLDPLVAIGPDGKITDANAAAEAVTGCSRQELVGTDFCDYFTDRERARAAHRQAFRKGPVRDYPLEMRHRDGHLTSVVYNASVYRDDEGRVAGVFAAARDVTERKRAEEEIRRVNADLEKRVAERTAELAASEQRFRTVAASTPDHLIIQDRELRYTLVMNPQLGLTEQDMLGKTDHEFLDKEDADRLTEIKRRVIATGESANLLVPLKSRSGETEYFEGAYVRKLDGAGRVDGVIGYFRNVTERKRAEERIRRLNEELQLRAGQLTVANKELEAFAYSVSHDLRAPLRSIGGFTRILMQEHRERLDAEGRDALERVSAATQRMDRLIDDLLTLSRIARSEMRLQTVDLSRLARTVIRGLRAAEPDRVVDCKIADGLTVRADHNLMRVVLENLLGNAWKFTAGRTPALIEFRAGEQERPRVFLVRDNGAGFDMAYAGKLFGAFQRLHGEAEFPGTGIGLATVQRILHRHGGRIWAEAAPGEGATFFFTLPA